MTTYNIQIEGLPEGWKPIAITTVGNIDSCNTIGALIHLEKIKPRRIVLEEDMTDNRNHASAQTLELSSGRIMHIFSPYAVREVKEGE